MRLIETISDFRHWRENLSAENTVGFVPTMGALHEGHATLLREMKRKTDVSVLSIFVNPTQFGPNEDLAKYPRTLDADLRLAAQEGVDAVFLPKAEELYPEGYSTFVEETAVSEPLCGKFRPGHFRGVTTIVLKLFNIVQPQTAFFGLKDAQQFLVLSKMVKDLNIPIELEGVATVRDASGLALSSRNRYLSPAALEKAPLLQRELAAVAEKRLTTTEARARLEAEGFNVQYFDELKIDGAQLVAAAAFLESTRLIDNVFLESALKSDSSKNNT